ncbi:hypothetical protein CPB85DRAFT_1230110 [Mucidula mucida]|nr:hypothetical protein CPB85DRAFT_1230110 [Mucidula mucida]
MNKLRRQNVLPELSKQYGNEYCIQHQLFTVVVQCVPISFDPNGFFGRLSIAEDNNFSSTDVLSAWWIKLQEKRRDSQQVANLLLGFPMRELANRAQHQGLIIEGRTCLVRKDRFKVTRYMKCQQLPRTHDAKTCPHDNVCGRCAKPHPTRECIIMDRALFRCANCNEDGHGAADRSCKVFHNANEAMIKQNPDMHYVYYPTLNPITWARDDDAQHTHQPPHATTSRPSTSPTTDAMC